MGDDAKSTVFKMPRNQCEHPGCMKHPCFNVPGSKAGRFCSEHKEESMVDEKHKPCEHPGCIKQPYFNVPCRKARRFCSEHKEESMVDVKNKTR